MYFTEVRRIIYQTCALLPEWLGNSAQTCVFANLLSVVDVFKALEKQSFKGFNSRQGLWIPLTLQCNGYRRLLPRGYSDWGVKLTTYLHSLCLHGVVPN
jgi:hypothetical protein